MMVFALLVGILLTGTATVNACEEEWDRSSLKSISEGYNCDNDGSVFATVRNNGDAMGGPVGWQLYYVSSGSPRQGTVIASGTIPALKRNGTHSISASASQGTGNYIFRVEQRPQHPGNGVFWSGEIAFSWERCAPAPTDTPEPTPTDVPYPMPTGSPEPTPTDTLDPTPTDVPEPTPTDVPASTPTDVPEPAPTDAPEPTPTDGEFLPVEPFAECINILGEGRYEALFAYHNPNSRAVEVPIGSENKFLEGDENRGQLTVFEPGWATDAFRVVFDGSTITWKLGTLAASASNETVLCLEQREETPTPSPGRTVMPPPEPTPMPPPEVPEPTSLLLLGSGIASVAGYLGLKRRRTDVKADRAK